MPGLFGKIIPDSNTKALQLQKKRARESAKRHNEKLRQLDKSTAQQNAALKKRLRRLAAPKNTSQCIRYQRMYEDGVCELNTGQFSRSFKFTDINYQTARRDDQEDIFRHYSALLNYCGPTLHLQITVLNRRIDKELFREQMFLRPAGDRLDSYRHEMNEMLNARALEGQNSILREKYMTFTTTAPSYEAAIPALARIESDLGGHFKSLGCEVRSLSGSERLELLHNHFRPEEKYTFTYTQLVASGLQTKDLIAPAGFDFQPKDHYYFDDYVGCCLYVRELPAELSDKVVSELTDLPIDLSVNIHIENVEQGQALETVKRQISYMEMEATGKQDAAVQKGRNTEIAVPMETRRAHEEACLLLDALENHNQRMFKVTILLHTFARDLEALQDNVWQIISTARKNNIKADKLLYLQMEGLNSVLPLGVNCLEIKRTLTTDSTAIFIPFTAQELYQSGGMYYGLNALSRNLIFFDRRTLKAPNGVILGTPGSGKSFASKREMINVLLSDPEAEVIIIDPEREYTPLAQGFDGEVVHISAGSKACINPMDITMDYADDDDPLLLKAEFILSLCELLVASKQGLSAGQKTVIDRACKLTYQPYFANPAKNPVPTLKEFYATLRSQPEPEAKSLALSLELYITGSLAVFARHTNVDIQKRLVVFDIKDLGKQLRTIGMLIVLDQIWVRITRNRKLRKRTWIYIDELQLLFQSEYNANYFFELWSRARKWGAIPTGITQNVETLLLSDLARRMLSNSDFIMMLNQAANDRAELARLLNISERQLSFVTGSEAGHGLLFAGKSIIPFIDQFPRDTSLYRMMTTKLEEVSD